MAHGEMHTKNASNVSKNSLANDHYTDEYVLLLSLLAALIFLVNSMIIYLFLTCDFLRTKTNTILASLACTDMLNGLAVIPLQITINIHIREESFRLASMVLYRFLAVSTMLHILAVTLERHICILSPLRYHSLVTKSRVIKTLVFTWFLSIGNSVISLSWIAMDKEYNHLRQPPGLQNSKLLRFEFGYTLTTVVFFFLTPLTIMAYSITKILKEISRHNRRDSELILDTTRQSNSTNTSAEVEQRVNRFRRLDRKPVLIFLTMLLVFALTWSSWYAQILILSVSPRHYKPVGGRWPAFARSSTSLINPLLYSLIKKDFRQAVKNWLTQIKNLFIFRNTPSSEQELTSKSTAEV